MVFGPIVVTCSTNSISIRPKIYLLVHRLRKYKRTDRQQKNLQAAHRLACIVRIVIVAISWICQRSINSKQSAFICRMRVRNNGAQWNPAHPLCNTYIIFINSNPNSKNFSATSTGRLNRIITHVILRMFRWFRVFMVAECRHDIRRSVIFGKTHRSPYRSYHSNSSVLTDDSIRHMLHVHINLVKRALSSIHALMCAFARRNFLDRIVGNLIARRNSELEIECITQYSHLIAIDMGCPVSILAQPVDPSSSNDM